MGADQVRPPSVDLERAMSSWAPLLKRPSSQTAYRVPVVRSTAMSGRPSLVRTGAPVSGSVTATDMSFEMMIGCDQVTPLSVERTTASKKPGAFIPDPFARLKISTRVPLGSTTIWLPTVNSRLFGAKIARAGSQVAPPSVVLENQMSPRKAKEWSALKSALSLGKRLRSHTAYTSETFVGSAVMDSLSLKLKADESLRTVIGSLQVSPPFVDLLTKMAEVMRSALAERLIW